MSLSSLIRGHQIAERLGAKLNPTEGYENDVCIYVKPGERKFEGIPYIDIVDEEGALIRHPEIPVIACSEFSGKVLSKYPHKKIVVIPQQHCNFERLKRTRNDITCVGMIGQSGAWLHVPDYIGERLKERGIELIQYSNFLTRQDIIDYHLKIDVQLMWRPFNLKMGNPLKLVNAMSFGIPTIALPDDGIGELDGYYLPAHTPEEVITQLDRLIKEPSLYEEYSLKGIAKAEEYHIDNICKLYKELT
jgi:hypothetical protein